MGVMGGAMRLALAFAAIVVLFSGFSSAFDGYDGKPRPTGMADTPTTTYGLTPKVKYQNKVADCTWYGFEDQNYYENVTQLCSKQLWATLSQKADPATLIGYTYYVPQEPEYYDPKFDEYFCAIGCFDLSGGSGPAPAPISPPPTTPQAPPPKTTTAPPPVDVSVPPTPVVNPPAPAPSPPAETPPPPPSVTPPPPATLFRPPPPRGPAPPPSNLAPSGAPSTTPPADGPESSPLAPTPGVSAGIITKPGFVAVGAMFSIIVYFLSSL